MLKRVHIIGGPGSGKTYSAERIAQRYGLPHLDLDDIFWDPEDDAYGVRNSPGARDAALHDAINQEAWVVEGVYYSWLQPSFDRAERVFVLKPSVYVRHWRIVRRFLRRKLGLAPGKNESFSDLVTLLKWNQQFDGRNLAAALKMLEEHREKVFIVENSREILEHF